MRWSSPKIPLIFNTAGRRQHGQSRRGVAADLPAAASRVTRRNWKRRARCSIEKFYDENRYRLGKVGRFRLNRKLGLGRQSEKEMTLRPDDMIAAIRYLIDCSIPTSDAEIDDIDHLGNRRLRTIDELACEELRKGFLKLRRTVQERMSLKDATT